MTKQEFKLGLFGFGVVGQGLYDIISQTEDIGFAVKTICIKHPDKKRPIQKNIFTTQPEDILNDPEINLIVELIDDPEAALVIVKKALNKGKNVVTANKKMVAENLEDLFNLQQKTGSSLLYEASSCGAIPIIRTLEEYYNNEPLQSLSGIFNGSSNYILSRILSDGFDYPTALKQAQELGFAESDPSLDVEGFDAMYKLIILANHAFGIFVRPQEVLRFGIQNLSETDIAFAKAKGFKIKLIASALMDEAQKVSLSVLPKFISPKHKLYNVENEYNGVLVKGRFSGEQLFIGKGAGGHPTGAAVLSDISANAYQYKFGYYKAKSPLNKTSLLEDEDINVYVRASKSVLENLHFTSISSQKENYIIGQIQREVFFKNLDAINKSNGIAILTD